MSPAEVEKIGLAHEPQPGAESSESSPPKIEAVPTAPPPRQKAAGWSGWVVGLLVLALVGSALAFGNQFQRSAQLEAQVESLGEELSRAQQELVAYEQQMDGVRSAVAGLSRDVLALEALVGQEPAEAVKR